MVLPLLKLGTLVLKSISKPVAGKLKQQASAHPKFRQAIINMAQRHHKFSTQMQRRIYGHSTDVAVRPLDEEKAIIHAVDLFGEIFVFSVAGALVIFEVHRSSRSEARKEEIRKQELDGVRSSTKRVGEALESLKYRLQALEQLHKKQPRLSDTKFQAGQCRRWEDRKSSLRP